MTRRGERRLAAVLWSAYAVLGAAGLAVLALALFLPPRPAEPPRAPTASALPSPLVLGLGTDDLASRRLTRRVAERPREEAAAPKGPAPIDSVLRLKGILDFGKSRPAVAVLELPAERKTKSFQAGETIGATGAVLKSVGDTVIVEYEKRRWKLTYKGAQEIPAGAVGDNR